MSAYIEQISMRSFFMQKSLVLYGWMGVGGYGWMDGSKSRATAIKHIERKQFMHLKCHKVDFNHARHFLPDFVYEMDIKYFSKAVLF